MSVFISQPAVGADGESEDSYRSRWSKFKNAAHRTEGRMGNAMHRAEHSMGDAMHHAKDGVVHAAQAAAKSARSMRKKMRDYDTPKDVPVDFE